MTYRAITPAASDSKRVQPELKSMECLQNMLLPIDVDGPGPIYSADRDILLLLKIKHNQNIGRRTSHSGHTNPDSWPGVTVTRDGRVVKLEILPPSPRKNCSVPVASRTKNPERAGKIQPSVLYFVEFVLTR